MAYLALRWLELWCGRECLWWVVNAKEVGDDTEAGGRVKKESQLTRRAYLVNTLGKARGWL